MSVLSVIMVVLGFVAIPACGLALLGIYLMRDLARPPQDDGHHQAVIGPEHVWRHVMGWFSARPRRLAFVPGDAAGPGAGEGEEA